MMLGVESCCLSLWFSVTAGEDKGLVFTKVLAFISTFTTVTITIAALAGSTSLTLLASLLVEDGVTRIGLPLRLAIGAFHLVTRAYRMFTFWLQCKSVVQFSFGMFSVLERMAPPDVCNASRDRSKIFLAGMQFARNYRAIAVVQAHYAGLYRHYIAIIQTASVFAVVYNTYQAVTGDSVRALLVALAVIFGHMQFIDATAQVYDSSADVLNRWRCVDRGDVPLWFPRYLRPCRKVYVPVGSFFYIDRGLVLTVLSIINNASSSLILAN